MSETVCVTVENRTCRLKHGGGTAEQPRVSLALYKSLRMYIFICLLIRKFAVCKIIWTVLCPMCGVEPLFRVVQTRLALLLQPPHWGCR